MSPPAAAKDDLETALLAGAPAGSQLHPSGAVGRRRRHSRWILPAFITLLSLGIVLVLLLSSESSSPDPTNPRDELSRSGIRGFSFSGEEGESIEAENGVVASDDGRCSEIGAAALRRGGHAVDAAVATALCLGVVNPMSSGVGGGAFMVVRDSRNGESLAFDSRETAPMAASKNMYASNLESKSKGALSAGVPGELAGLYAAWVKYGRLPWSSLLTPSVELARDGFLVSQYLANGLSSKEDDILGDPGLREVFSRDGKLLRAGDVCYNRKLASTLEAVAKDGPQAFYNGSAGEAFVNDVQIAGGVMTMEDLRRYQVEVTKAVVADVLGYELIGMPPPSSGTVGMTMVLNILESYGSPDAAKGLVGLHRLVEALKHMFAVRMNLGDPDFVHTTKTVSEMLSKSFAEKVRGRILDNTTFGPEYYLPKWSQLHDHGTSHFCVVDAQRNAVSMTSTVNYYFGAKVLSPSTGIVLNNEMDDFSAPTEIAPDLLPPAPANFIEPGKRPLSSMTPIIVLKDNQLAGVIGGSGGMCIIPAVVQVFINHFVKGMEPLEAVQHPRVYHKLIPNQVTYENLTAIDGEHIELAEEARVFLKGLGHELAATGACSVCQLVVHDLLKPLPRTMVSNRIKGFLKLGGENDVFHGMLKAVSDPRKNGAAAGI